MNIPIEGISISHTLNAVHVQSDSALSTLSSAIVGSGFQRVHHILNFHVDKNYYCPNPKADLDAFAGRVGINERFIGLLTAVNLNKARLVLRWVGCRSACYCRRKQCCLCGSHSTFFASTRDH